MTLDEVRNGLRAAENFVLFRLPNEGTGHCFTSDHVDIHDSFPTDFALLKEAFVMVPFSLKNHQILSISSENSIVFKVDGLSLPTQKEERWTDTLPSEDYSVAFEKFVSVIRSGAFPKLVLSRSCSFPIQVKDPVLLFEKACKAYPDAMVYLWHSPLSGDWLGASPELLLSGDDSQLRTVALAGTVRNEGANVSSTMRIWGEKERLEQRLVADYVRERISMFGTLKDEWGPYTVSAGHLSHLRNDFYFFMDEKERMDFLSSLHPTPAVCGLPKEEAQRFILENEGYDREYYSGFMGWTDSSGKCNLYVNLRCMKFDEQMVRLFAGGGILASSSLRSEWNETEEKMATMKRLING